MPSLSSLKGLAPTIGGSIIGGLINRSAAGKATNRITGGIDNATGAIQTGANQANQTLADIYKDQTNTLSPYSEAGKASLGTLQEGLQPGGGFNSPFNNETFDLYKDPSFQWRLAQGQKAIDAGANASGKRFTGATLKALDRYAGNEASQEWTAADARYQADVTGRFNRQMGMANIGERAAEQQVNAGGTYGTNVAKIQESTAAQIADLETERATAEANGDIAKANSITDTIGGILKGVDNAKTLAALKPVSTAVTNTGVGALSKGMAPTLADLGPGAAGPVAADFGGIAGAGVGAGAGIAGSAGTSLSAVAAGAVPEIPLSGIGAGIAGAGGAGAGGAGAGAGTITAPGVTSGLGPAITGFLTNPITIGVGAAIAAGIIWRKSQAHPTADKFVQGYQKPFEKHLFSIVNQFDNTLAGGQLDRGTAQQLRDEVAQFIQGFDADIAGYRQKGGKNKTVADQAKAEMTKDFGPNWERILGKMDQEIAQLPTA